MSEKTPWEQVEDASYFRSVLGNMTNLGFGPLRGELGYVRFGTTGIGYAPNYQIEDEDGEKSCFRGLGHGPTADAGDELDPENLSRQFSYIEVRDMLARLISVVDHGKRI